MVNVTLAMAAEITDFDESLLGKAPRGWPAVTRAEMLLSLKDRSLLTELRHGHCQPLLQKKTDVNNLMPLVKAKTTKFASSYTHPTKLHSISCFHVNEASHEGTAKVLDGYVLMSYF